MVSFLRSRREAVKSKLSPEELIALVRRYVIQETVGPLKAILRSLALGLAGAVVLAIGAALMLLGLLRALETETGRFFAGSYTFAPFLLTAAAAFAAIGFAALIGMRSARRAARRRVEVAR